MGSMKIEDFDWRAGRVEYWTLDRIGGDDAPADHRRWDLKEDLALVRFPGEVCLDIGWYPQGSPDGRFVMLVVRDEDWCTPLMRSEHATAKDLATALPDAIAFADRAGTGTIR
jgi:hypothetical protein